MAESSAAGLAGIELEDARNPRRSSASAAAPTSQAEDGVVVSVARGSQPAVSNTSFASVRSRSTIQTAQRLSMARLVSDMSEGESQAVDRSTGGGSLTFWQAVSSIVLTMVGAGINVLPSVAAQVGFVPACILILVCYLVITECGMLTLSALDTLELSRGAAAGPLANWEQLVKPILGPGAEKLMRLSNTGVLLGAIILSATLQTQSIVELLPGSWFCGARANQEECGKQLALLVRLLMVLPLLVGFALIRDMAQLSRLSPLGVFGMCLQVSALIVGFALQLLSNGPSPVDTWTPGGTIPNSLGLGAANFYFSFSAVLCLPNIRSQMQQPQQAGAMFRMSMVITIYLYGAVMLLGYGTFGSSVKDNVMVAVAETEPLIGRIGCLGLLLNCSVSIPIYYFIVMKSCGDLSEQTAFRASVMVVLVLVSVVFKSLKATIGLVSSVFLVINSAYFPLTTFYVQQQTQGASGRPPVSSLRQNAHILVAVFSGLVLIFGFQGAFHELLQEYFPDAPAEQRSTV
eukprot:TRINITY_DN42622_c0_g1_i1.p1 TRINITY_DN42622_c0_g1~~TRINITY_DN42622_c0_g1_i1.p1  ORF type:complete len:527 (-),score=80.45 TRINITY_DN42622_c0_g1_i1:59-1609(-)